MSANPVRIFVPVDAAALSVGAEAVAQTIASEAAVRGLAIEVVRNGSRGMLWLEPMVEVETNEGRIAYGPVAAKDVPSLFDAGLVTGGAHGLRLGKTEELDWMKRQQRLTFERVGVIDPLSIADYRAHGGFKGLEKALALTGGEIVEAVKASGLRGRGGAGFPTGIKWKTVHDAKAEQKYIVCNADEGDSGTFADRMLFEGDPYLTIEGMTIAAIAVGATRGYIYLRSEYPHAHRTLQRAILKAEAAGLIGASVLGSEHAFHLEVRLGAGAYICGEETSLLESLEGKRAIVRAKPPLPALQGLFGKPTVVNNVLSFAAVPWILDHGAQAYADYGMGRSRGTLPIQLGGNVKRGGLIELAFGISLREIIEDMGGGTLSGRPIRAVQVGGPLGAYLTAGQLDVQMDYEALAAMRAMLGHGGIVVFDDSVDMARQARFAFAFCAKESCGKCTPCRIGATRGVETMDRIIAGTEVPKNIAVLRDLSKLMTDASLCAMGGLTPMPVLSALNHFPEDFDREGPCPAPSPLAGEGWGEGSRDAARLAPSRLQSGDRSAPPHPAAARPPSPARGEGEPTAERRI
jgi:formate dehydrogenase iron-sulfur subunit